MRYFLSVVGAPELPEYGQAYALSHFFEDPFLMERWVSGDKWIDYRELIEAFGVGGDSGDYEEISKKSF